MKKIWEEVNDCIKSKNYNLLFWYGLLFMSISFLVVLLFYIAITFIGNNLEAIITISCIFFFVISMWIERKDKKERERASILQANAEKNAFFEQEQAEQNYKLLHKVVFVILTELHEVLKIKQPQFMSEVVAETQTYQKGNTIYYQYCCLQSEEEPLDTTAFRDIMQQRISQKLLAGELYGITQSVYVYEGRTYPLIRVVDVEKVGINLYITLTIVNEEYCKEMKFKALAKQQIIKQQRLEISDKDF